MTSTTLAIIICLLTSQTFAWEALPQIPSGRRSQFLVLRDDGAYKYGYDTGDGQAAKQEGDTSNQVQGHYFYTNKAGKSVDLKYTSGVQGFVPEGLDKLQELIKSSAPSGPSAPSNSYLPAAEPYSGSGSPETGDDGDDGSYRPEKYENEGTSGDASYNFGIDTSSYKRTESSDSQGNVQGSYSYNNQQGTHDLQYIAGAETGFVARSGSLSKPNGLNGGGGAGARSGAYQEPSSGGYSYPAPNSGGAAPESSAPSDGSYSFGFSTGDQSREESADSTGNVRGRYSYRNKAGSHDLSYKAGAETGFVVTGGSLSKPNGLPNGAGPSGSDYSSPSSYSAPSSGSSGSFRSSSSGSGDGSYSFGFSTGSQERQEDSDSSGNVRGRFSYKNSAGTHDLSYVAGASTGFLPTGGSLSQPNGLKGGSAPNAAPSSGGYSYNPPSSGAYTGEDSGAYSGDSQDDQADSGDSSYNFSFDTPEYTREEASDARGNVRGSFRYRNRAGSHDLSFVAGSATGYKPTGGSLSEPNGLAGKIVTPPESPSAPLVSVPNTYLPPDTDTVEVGAARSAGDDESNSGDSSYNFSFDTPEYTRQESSDAGGNVMGRFSYRNSVGNHDLSFEAGSRTGFKPTGGSLTPAPGLSESQLRAGFRGSGSSSGSVSSRVSSFVSGGGSSGYEAPAAPLPHTKATSYSLGNVKVHTYLPPSNEKHKFGYIFDSQ